MNLHNLLDRWLKADPDKKLEVHRDEHQITARVVGCTGLTTEVFAEVTENSVAEAMRRLETELRKIEKVVARKGKKRSKRTPTRFAGKPDNNGAKAAFVSLCREHGVSLLVWVGFSAAQNREVVCYGGGLSDCEKAENANLPQKVQAKYPGVGFCYVYPSPAGADKTY